MINIKQWISRGNSGTRHDKHNRAFKINNGMKPTFVFVYRNGAMFAGRMTDCEVIFNNNVV